MKAEHQGHPETVDVRPRAGFLRRLDSLRRREQECSPRQRPRPSGPVPGRSEIEVRQDRRPRRIEQDVRGLHVTVDDTPLVRGRERVADAKDEGHRLRRWKPPADDRAMEVVAGFTIMNDWSARDLQRKEMAVGLGPSKGKDFATSLGPDLVTLDELKDRYRDGRLHLEMTAAVNGRLLSRGNSGAMFWTWPQLLAHASRDATLRPGDVLGSGTVGTGCILELTPEAVGGWLAPGDVVELTVERLGTLRNRVVAHP